MICKACKTKISASIDIVGGCTCGPNDEYCYCPSRDIEVYIHCTCKGYKKINQLSDRYSLERFISDHLTEKDLI